MDEDIYIAGFNSEISNSGQTIEFDVVPQSKLKELRFIPGYLFIKKVPKPFSNSLKEFSQGDIKRVGYISYGIINFEGKKVARIGFYFPKKHLDSEFSKPLEVTFERQPSPQYKGLGVYLELIAKTYLAKYRGVTHFISPSIASHARLRQLKKVGLKSDVLVSEREWGMGLGKAIRRRTKPI